MRHNEDTTFLASHFVSCILSNFLFCILSDGGEKKGAPAGFTATEEDNFLVLTILDLHVVPPDTGQI
jgi:hypothetical protein